MLNKLNSVLQEKKFNSVLQEKKMFNLLGAEIYFFHNLAKCFSLLLLVLFFNNHLTKKGPFLTGYCKLFYTAGQRLTKKYYVKLVLNLNVKIYVITP